MPTSHAAAKNSEERRWLTLGGACRLLGVDESTMRRWSDSGYVRTFRTPGGHRRFAERDLQELLEGRRPGDQPYHELGDLTITRIRRRLHRPAIRDASWLTTVDDRIRERFRQLGRRLAALSADYLGRRRGRPGLLTDARELGHEYGRELAAAGLPLAQAVEAFTFFRRGLGDATRQATQTQDLSVTDALSACEQVTGLADQVLVGMTEAYEGVSTNRKRASAVR